MGGSSRHVVDLVNGLDPELFDIALVYGTSRVDEYFAAALPGMAKRARLIPCDDLVRPISPQHELRALRFVKRVIREFKPGIVHCHSSKAGIIGRLTAKQCGVRKVFYTPHAYSFQAPEFSGKKRMVFVGLERWFSRHATTLTFNVSEGERRAALAERLDNPSKFETVYNGVRDIVMPSRAEALDVLGLGQTIPADAPVVGVTARLVEQKDPMTSIAVAAKVIERRPDTHVIYVGDGPYEERMRGFAAEHGVEANVHLLGYRPDAERIVGAFDVYLLTSLYEGMPYSLVEALRAGVPIAATDVTGNDEVVEPHHNGLLFPIGDAEAGADAVLELLDRRIPSEQVRQTYLDRFTLERMLRRITEAYLR
ncbi:glycosyltransferase [Bifidobacterium lemurum]|nr:glycosyltransferase [Bifidobacterium lemurum]